MLTASGDRASALELSIAIAIILGTLLAVTLAWNQGLSIRLEQFIRLAIRF